MGLYHLYIFSSFISEQQKDEWLQDAKQVYHAAHIFAFSASRKNSPVIFVSVCLANAQNLTRGDGLTDGWLVREHASQHFLQKIWAGIFCTTQELTLPKCKRHLHKISWEFNQNILLNATNTQHSRCWMWQLICVFCEYLNYLLNVNERPEKKERFFVIR